ncbi:MAG TPA: RNA-directed DNA polymerase [Gallicola sp.]|nr:RNA-directed DNA polymerase [Gallicola sp.]
MQEQVSNVLSLNSSDVYNFLLKRENYFNVDMPEYIDFAKILKQVDKVFLDSQPLEDIIEEKKCRASYKANHKLFSNKDGKYEWRPFSLIHPILYIYLARIIRDNWKLIKNVLSKKTPHIKCVSIPSLSKGEKTATENDILNWWTNFEQESISLSIKYKYIFKTDITDCYGSIYTHTIAWALHGKTIAKSKRNDMLLCGNKIDKTIGLMQNGQTNGIPQGSAIMDFIAELVLKYADVELQTFINKKKYDCKILRYRDDYRIFTNNINTGREIIRDLSLVLQELNMKLNSQKTIESEDVILNSLKKEKIEYLKWKFDDNNIEKKLLSIYLYSIENPNSGQLFNMLKEFYTYLRNKRIQKVYIDPMIGILTQLAIKNPKVYPQCIAAISYLLENQTPKEKGLKIREIIFLFKEQPNSELVWFWIHRLMITNLNKYNVQRKVVKRIKRYIKIENGSLWDITFVKRRNMKKILLLENLFDYSKILTLESVISEKEYGLFKDANQY